MKRIVIVGVAVALLVLLVTALVLWMQTSQIERRLPGGERAGDHYRWYCTVPSSGFGLCSSSAPQRLLPEDDDAEVLRPRAAACFFHHRISTDETRAVCAYNIEGCEAVRTAFAKAPDINELGDCAGVDLLELYLRRSKAQAVAVVAAAWCVCFALLLLALRWIDRRYGAP